MPTFKANGKKSAISAHSSSNLKMPVNLALKFIAQYLNPSLRYSLLATCNSLLGFPDILA